MTRTTDRVDVITVPDFTGTAAERFELRTLLFLGSWLRCPGRSRAWPLHLACIGEPPVTVRRLAKQAGASITVHAPMPTPHAVTSNKLRGLEIEPTADRCLLLDTDMLILRDLAPLAEVVGDAIGVGPATFNHLQEDTWRQIYAAVTLPYPGPAGTCWHAQFDLSAWERLSPEAAAQCRAMPPYYNSGVLMAPWSLGLGGVWRDHLERLHAAFAGQTVASQPKWIRHADQHSLATAVEAARLAGARVVTLPLGYQARPPLLAAGVIPWSEVALFHYVKVLRPHGESLADLHRLLYGRRLRAARRWLAGRIGLKAVRSPVTRLVDRTHLQAFDGFFEQAHAIVQSFGL